VNTYTYTQPNTAGITQPYTQLYTLANFRAFSLWNNALETGEKTD